MSEVLSYDLISPEDTPEKVNESLAWLKKNYKLWEPINISTRLDLSYPTQEAAIQEVSEELENGEGVVVTLAERAPSQTILTLQERIDSNKQKIVDYKENIVSSLADRTSKYTKCPTCGSAVAVKFIKSLNCPVCGSEELLMTNTHQKRLNAYETAIQKIQEQITEKLEHGRSKVVKTSMFVIGKVPA